MCIGSLPDWPVANDPLEATNIAGTGDADEADLVNEINSHWDEAKLEKDVLEPQEKRLFFQNAMKQGQFPSWDYAPPFDPSRAYVRGAIDPNTTATKARKRFPFVATPPPQKPR